MSGLTVTEEATALAMLRPSRQELAGVEAAIAMVLNGITRTGAGWRVDPSLAHLVRDRDPALVVRVAKRGRNVIRTAERLMSAG